MSCLPCSTCPGVAWAGIYRTKRCFLARGGHDRPDEFIPARSHRARKLNDLAAGMPVAFQRRGPKKCVNPSPSQPPGPLTRELLDYWIQHPEAQATVEAIVEWWLLEQRIQKAADEVRLVLAELVAEEFVVERQQADGRICYRLNKEKETEMRAWLQVLCEG